MGREWFCVPDTDDSGWLDGSHGFKQSERFSFLGVGVRAGGVCDVAVMS